MGISRISTTGVRIELLTAMISIYFKIFSGKVQSVAGISAELFVLVLKG